MQVTVDMIKNNSIFSRLDEKDIAASLHIFKLVKPGKSNYRIFEEGAVGDSFFLILKGQVEIQKLIDSEKGTYKILAVLPEGAAFGEMALLTGETRSASAVLQDSDGILIKIERNDLMKFMSSTPEVASLLLGAIVGSLSDRLRASSNEVVTLYETGKIIGNTSNFNEMVSQVLDRLIKATESTAGFVMMWNDIVECFECKIGIPEVPPVTTLANNSVLSRYWQNLMVPVTEKTTEEFIETDELGFRMPSVMYIPLSLKHDKVEKNGVLHGRVAGVAVLVSKESNAYSLQHINLSRSVAEQVSQAIINSRLMMENEARREHELVYVTANL